MELWPIMDGKRCHPPIRKTCSKPSTVGICLLHFSDFLFHHIFQNTDSQTAVPKSFNGAPDTKSVSVKTPRFQLCTYRLFHTWYRQNFFNERPTVFIMYFKYNHFGTLSRRPDKAGPRFIVRYHMINCSQPTLII